MSNESFDIDKMIDKRIKKIVIKYLIIFFSIFIGIYYIGSPIIEMMYYKPNFESINDKASNDSIMLDTIINSNYPDLQLVSKNVQNQKFSSYTASLQLANFFYPVGVGQGYNTKINFKFGEITAIKSLASLSKEYGAYRNDNIYKTKANLDDDLLNIPNMFSLNVDIAFNEPISIQDFVDLVKKYPSVYFNFGNIIVDQVTKTSFGFKYSSNVRYDLPQEFEEVYPNFFIENLDRESLEQHIKSRAQFVVDNRKLFNKLNFVNTEDNNDLYNSYKQLLTKPITISGVNIYSNIENFKSFMNDDKVYSYFIRDFKSKHTTSVGIYKNDSYFID